MIDATLTSSPKAADPIAALVAVAVSMLCATGFPERLGLAASTLWLWGGGVIAVAAAARAVVHYMRGESISLNEPFAAVLATVGIILGASGVPDAFELDASAQGAIASLVAGLFAFIRTARERSVARV